MLNMLLLTLMLLIPSVLSAYIGGGNFERTGKEEFMSRDYTTCMKGFAIIFIMLSHCSSYWGVYYTPLGGIGVAIFLILSGYGLNESFKKNGLKGFWPKRIGRMMLPYAIAIGIMTIVSGYSFWWFLQNVLCVKTYYWFIAYMMYWYIAFWVVSATPFLKEHRVPVFLVLSLLCFFFLNHEQALSFTAGVILSQYKSEIKQYATKHSKRVDAYSIILIMMAILALGAKQLPTIREASDPIIMKPLEFILKFGAGFGLILLLRNSRIFHHSRFLLFTGVISYELYLVHYPFYTIIGTSLSAMVALIVCSYIVAWGFQKLNTLILQLII